MTNQHDSSWGALCSGVQHICVVALLHLDVLQPGDRELMILSIVPQSGVNYIITNIPDENSISALQPWSQFWSPPFQGRRAWPQQGSTAPPWTSKWSMSWHRSQTWLLGLRISRVRKYWIFAVFRQNTRCKRQAQFLQLLQNPQSSLHWSQTWGWFFLNLEWHQLFDWYYFMIKRQCLHYYFNW